MTKLIMRRSGTFLCRWNSTDGKCGTRDHLTPVYHYECVIEALPVLDQNGFLMDQLDIDKYFQNRYYGDQVPTYSLHNPTGTPSHPPRSCEQIALNAINDITYLLRGHLNKTHGAMDVGSIVKSVRVSVGVDQQAVMTAEWTPDKSRK